MLVQFLYGTSAALAPYLENALEDNRKEATLGAFYLTTDTHKLYTGQQIGERVCAVPVSAEAVSLSVKSEEDLPTSGVEIGTITYITEDNSIKVFNGDSWVYPNISQISGEILEDGGLKISLGDNNYITLGAGDGIQFIKNSETNEITIKSNSTLEWGTFDE